MRFYFHISVIAVTELLFYLISVKTYNWEAYSGFDKINVTAKLRQENFVILCLKTVFVHNGKYLYISESELCYNIYLLQLGFQPVAVVGQRVSRFIASVFIKIKPSRYYFVF
jgi:hypothetical protein